MDSRSVNKAIASIVRPMLKKHGFSKFTQRTSWRFSGETIDVLNFQSFNSHLAEGLKCTTYSFSLNLGCYFSYIPDQFPVKSKEGLKLPQEYQCQFRGKLNRSFKQDGLDRTDIWYIDPEGLYLEQAITDAAAQILTKGLPWFARYASPSDVLRTLQESDEKMSDAWGFGCNPSPIRHYMTAYTARRLGNSTLEEQCLAKAIESGCFKNQFTTIEEAKKYAP